ncbi:MAG: hypothetical protein OHK0013_38400 [Sandaracinaceae bacterium]
MEELREHALRAGDLEAVLGWAERATGVAVRRHAVDLVERALLLADPGTASAAVLQRAAALGVSRSVCEAARTELPPHAVRVPFVVRESAQGASRALVRAVMVAFDASEAPRASWVLTPESARAATEAIRLAAREAPPGSPVERFHLVPVQPAALQGVIVEGPSLAAAAYVSALALFSGRRARASVAVTGAIHGRALVRVDGLAEKAAACARAGLGALLVPDEAGEADAAIEIVAVRDLEALAAAALEPGRADADVDAEVRAAVRASETGWNGYRWPAVREIVARALARVPSRRPELRVELLARLAAAERHLGRIDASLACVAEAQAIVQSPIAKVALPDEQRVRLERQRAMSLLRALQLAQARRAAMRSVAIARRARLRGELIASLGAEGLCAMARGEADAAVQRFDEALSHTLEHQPSNAARSRAYLVEALGRAGRGREAAREYRLALREAEDDARRGVDGKVAWVRTSYAAALLALGRVREVLDVLAHPSVDAAIAGAPMPGLRARRLRGLAWARRARGRREWEAALALLEGSPFAYDGLEPALRTMAHVNVMWAARLRAERGEVRPRETLDASLASLPDVPALRDEVRAVRRALERRDPVRLSTALDGLLAVAEWL